MAATFSHSRLASFEDCPKKYEYRYIQKIKRDTESIEGFVGKRVHEVLERLYLAVGRGQLPTLPKVLHRYGALFDENFDAERVLVVRKETPIAEYRENGERSLSNYYRKHYPFDADETLGVEQRISFDLDGSGRFRILGFVDRISRARDAAIEIHDYKTSRWVPKQEQLDVDRQLALYQIATAERYGDDQPMRLVWHYVARNQTRTSTRTREQLDALRSETVTLIDRIRGTAVFEPRPSPLCSWCEYNDICPAFVGKGEQKVASGPGSDTSAEGEIQTDGAVGTPARQPGQLSLL